MITVNVDSNLNKNILIVGAGEAGGRIAQEFSDQGFANVIVINSAETDLAGLERIDQDCKFLIPISGGKGAGKNPDKVREGIDLYYEDAKNFIESKRGECMQALIIVGGGGGTGGGLGIVLAQAISEFEPTMDIGMIFTLPQKSEATLVSLNALNNLKEIYGNVKNSAISPFIIVDNNELTKRYRGTVKDFWKPVNSAVVQVIRSFNELSQKPTKYVSGLDGEDLKRLTSVGGCCAIGSVDISEVDSEETIMQKIESSFFMSGFDLNSSRGAGIIVTGSEETLGHDNSGRFLDIIFEKVGEIQSGGMIFRGVYEDSNVKFLRLYILFNGMALPEERLDDMVKEVSEGYDKMRAQDNRIGDGIHFDIGKNVAGIFDGQAGKGGKITRNTSSMFGQPRGGGESGDRPKPILKEIKKDENIKRKER